MKTKIVLLTIKVLITTLSIECFSQKTEFINQNALWIKGESFEKKTVTNEELEEYLNFNSPIDLYKISSKQNNLVTNKSTVFVVYVSKTDGLSLMRIEKDDVRINYKSDSINSFDQSYKLKKLKQGSLICHTFNKAIKSKNNYNLTICDFVKNDGVDFQIYELIYFPKALNKKQKAIIESYLSIKYGISLIEENDYLNASGEVLWNSKENSAFSQRVNGIGFDLNTGLNQKQSVNSTSKDIIVGLSDIKIKNSENLSILNDNDYLLWGDNGKELSFNSKQNNLYDLKRIWKFQTTQKNFDIPLEIKISKKVSLPSELKDKYISDNFYLAIDYSDGNAFDFQNAEYKKISNLDDNYFTCNDFYPENNFKLTLVYLDTTDVSKQPLKVDQELTKVYPNPVKSGTSFNIDINNTKELNTAIKIIDLNGRIIIQ